MLALLLGVSSAAFADTAPVLKTALVRGTVERIDPTTLTIKTDAGAEIIATITAKSAFGAVEPRTFSQIKPSDFVGVTAVPGRNGHLRAEEIHIIPVVGLGEGQYPWDHHPQSARVSSTDMGSMTNGSVVTARAAPRDDGSMTNGTVVQSGGPQELNISYHGAEMIAGKCEGRAVPGKAGCTGTAVVDVLPDTQIVAIVGANRADVKEGLAVVAAIATDDVGHTFLGSATLEKNGVKPPF